MSGNLSKLKMVEEEISKEIYIAFSIADTPSLPSDKKVHENQELLIEEIDSIFRLYPLQEPLAILKQKTELHYYHS